MRLSTTVRYGARAMAELACARSNGAVSVREIAERLHVSPKYLEQILKSLKAAGLVQAVHGKQGGYVLARPAESITLKQVFEALEGTLAPVDCVDHDGSCPLQSVCATWETWSELKEAIERVLEQTTLQRLAQRMEQKEILRVRCITFDSTGDGLPAHADQAGRSNGGTGLSHGAQLSRAN